MSDRGENGGRRFSLRAVVWTLMAVVGAAFGAMFAVAAVDLQVTGGSWAELVGSIQREGLRASVDSLAEVLAAVLGISLTVVAIVVQLAAARYPAKIVDVFMYDKVNLGVFGFMTASCIYVTTLPMLSAQEPVPTISLLLGVALTAANFGLLLPYFAHVFAFLEPTNLISAIEQRAVDAIEGVARGETREVRGAQRRVAVSLDRIADNCMAAVGQVDRNLALHSLRTLEEFLLLYIKEKRTLPAAWSEVEWDFFGTLAQEFVDEIVAHGTWLEAKGLMEFERVLRLAITEMTEAVSQIARSTRMIGELALREGETEVVELVVRFFNTYIRHGLTKRNVRGVYNILYEYRRLALEMLREDQLLAQGIVDHLVYYGRTANEMGLPFVTVTVAHDVRVICEEAHGYYSIDQRALLEKFLTLDQPVEGNRQAEVALVGVRKAQSLLGAFYLHHGEAELAELIREDMAHEDRGRLSRICDELRRVEERKFWEITDRGHNFDWVEPELREHLLEFFAPRLGAPGSGEVGDLESEGEGA